MIDKTFCPLVSDVNCSQPAPGRHPVRLINPGSWNMQRPSKVSPADFTFSSQFYGNLQFRQTRKEKGDKTGEREGGRREESWQIIFVIILVSILSVYSLLSSVT